MLACETHVFRLFPRPVTVPAQARASAAAVGAGRTPQGTRIYAIGDVHGCGDLLARLEDRIAADLRRDPPARAVVVCLGDYVDRGPHAKPVLDRLAAGSVAGARTVCLMGNHEHLMLQALARPEPRTVGLWLANGGDETLRSYGVDPAGPDGVALPARFRLSPAQSAALMAAFGDALPAAHRIFLARLALWHKEGGYAFVHAGIRPGVPLERQRDEDLLWIREPFLQSTQDFGFVVVHGHTVRREPEVTANRIGIDTGAYLHGRLCAAVLDGNARRFLFS